MSFEVQVLADSVAPGCPRLTTYGLRYPKQVHGEHLWLRAQSFSVSSGRAVPARKQLEAVRRDPAMPAYWGREQSGMSPGAPFTPEEVRQIEALWLKARDACLDAAQEMAEIGVHKSLLGRTVFPWAHYEMVCTGCAPGWMNFFALRCSRKADPTIRRLAVAMALAYRDSVPEDVGPGGYHAPYWTAEERDDVKIIVKYSSVRKTLDFAAHREAIWRLIKLSVARTARVSYEHHGFVERSEEKDLALFDRMLESGHFSVFEHVARAPFPGESAEGLHGNLPGWVQLRQCLTPNVHTEFDFAVLDQFPEDVESARTAAGRVST